MADCYYLDAGRNQQGPVPTEEIARLIRSGTIRRDTMLWYAGMPDWRPAGQVSEFASLFAQAAPPRPPAAPFSPQPGRQGAAPSFPAAPPGRMAAPAVADGAPADRLIVQLGVWGLFWRSLLVILGNFVVIPAPWTTTAIYRYFGQNTWLPDGRRLTFTGQAGDIWYVFIGLALLGLVGQVFSAAVLITLPLSSMLNYVVFRWLCDKVGSEDGSVKLAFAGGFWGYFGWSMLVFVSVFTIIGWAWVLKFFLQWICRNINGTVNFDFVGTGWGILWRTIVFSLASIFIIPIPWLMRWYSVWLVSQVRVDDLAAHFD
jgi:GYF domain 2